MSAFMQNLSWSRIAEHFGSAVAASAAAIEIAPGALVPLLTEWQVIDGRRRPVFEEAQKRISHADWRDPERVDAWAGDLDRSRPIAVYCVHGHAISRATALALARRGFDAHCVAGGLEAWSARGLPVETKGA
jgi:Fe-Mn family superoxide dismutase